MQTAAPMPIPAIVPGFIPLEPPDGSDVVVGAAVVAAALDADGVDCPVERVVAGFVWVVGVLARVEVDMLKPAAE